MKTIIACLLLLVALVAVPRDASARVEIVTTIQTLKVIAQEIGGKKVSAKALVGENVDPHHVDAKPSYAKALNKADLLIYVGLDLEAGWLPALIEAARNGKVQTGKPGNLNVSDKITVLDAGTKSRAEGDIHPLGNPHYWLAPDNALLIARAIADRLKEIDSTNADYYESNYKAFAATMVTRQKAWNEAAKALAGVKVVTYHKSWSYTTGWLGLVEIGYIEPKPGVQADSQHLAKLIAAAKKQGAKMVIVESYYPRNTASAVATKSGMKLVVLPSDAGGQLKSYWDLVDYVVAQLADAAK